MKTIRTSLIFFCSFPRKLDNHVWMCVSQGYANTEESLGKCVLLLISGGELQSGEVALSSTAKMTAALRLLFTKQPA